jgi:hypothetical protein
MYPPKYWLIEFKTKDAWSMAAYNRGALIYDAPEECGHPYGTLFAALEDGSIGICFPDGTGTLLKERAGMH